MTIRIPLAYILLATLCPLGCEPTGSAPADTPPADTPMDPTSEGPSCEDPPYIGPFSCTGVECATTDEEVELLTVLQEEIDQREAGERLQIVEIEADYDEYIVMFRYHDDWFESYTSSYFNFGTDYAISDPPTRWRAVFDEYFADAPQVRELPELLDTLAECDPEVVFDRCSHAASDNGPKLVVGHGESCGFARIEIDAVTGELLRCDEDDPNACDGMTG